MKMTAETDCQSAPPLRARVAPRIEGKSPAIVTVITEAAEAKQRAEPKATVNGAKRPIIRSLRERQPTPKTVRQRKQEEVQQRKRDRAARLKSLLGTVGVAVQPIPQWKIDMQAKPSGTTMPISEANAIRSKEDKSTRKRAEKSLLGTAGPLSEGGQPKVSKSQRKREKKKAKRLAKRRASNKSANVSVSLKVANLDLMAKVAGWPSYDAYINSEEWASVRRLFKSLWITCRCVGCDDKHFQLHHTTYERFGRERLTDLIPLCQFCHSKLHRVHAREKIPLRDYRRGLGVMFGWSPEETSLRLADYQANIRDITAIDSR